MGWYLATLWLAVMLTGALIVRGIHRYAEEAASVLDREWEHAENAWVNRVRVRRSV